MVGMRLVVVIAALAACSSGDASKQDRPAPKTATPSTSPAGAAGSGSAPQAPIETVVDKMPKPSTAGGDPDEMLKTETGEEWVPAEFKKGGARWRDIGVYVDGKPLGFLTWGELPLALKPTWVKDKVSAEKRAGTNDPGWRWAKQRFYRWDHYLKAVGVDVRRVKEMHVYGPKFTNTNITTSKDILGPKGKTFMFRFGGNTSGKPIGFFPDRIGNGQSADKVAGVMIYIDKKPPTLVADEGMMLDGVLQTGIPYYGEPIRGGIRVYLDDKLAAIIKRQDLDAATATKGPNGELRWKLADVLAAQGTKLDKVVEAWVIRDDKRNEKLAGKELATITFAASKRGRGGILLGDANIRANHLALHTRAVKPDEIPTVTPDDE